MRNKHPGTYDGAPAAGCVELNPRHKFEWSFLRLARSSAIHALRTFRAFNIRIFDRWGIGRPFRCGLSGIQAGNAWPCTCNPARRETERNSNLRDMSRSHEHRVSGKEGEKARS